MDDIVTQDFYINTISPKIRVELRKHNIWMLEQEMFLARQTEIRDKLIHNRYIVPQKRQSFNNFHKQMDKYDNFPHKR